MSPTALTAMQQGLHSCETCGLLSRPAPGEEEGRCPRCDALAKMSGDIAAAIRAEAEEKS